MVFLLFQYFHSQFDLQTSAVTSNVRTVGSIGTDGTHYNTPLRSDTTRANNPAQIQSGTATAENDSFGVDRWVGTTTTTTTTTTQQH